MILDANAQDDLNVIPDAHRVTMPGLGHVPRKEGPDPIDRIHRIRAFLVQ